jgi:hypothetical protein
MAAGVLRGPGTKHGPCANVCQHFDCDETRRMAAEVCRFCRKPIDYGVAFYRDPDVPESPPRPRRASVALVHAACLEDHYEKARTP